MSHLSLGLLGHFQAALDGQPITSWKSNKIKALLAYLAVEADRPHPREALAGLLWPDYADSSALSNLRDALAALRQAIGDRAADPPFLLITRDSVQFNPDSDHALDLHDLAQADLDRLDIDRLDHIVAAYRGAFLEGFSCDSAAFEEWALVQREQLGRRMLEALARLAMLYEERGEYQQAEHAARRQLELEPWREEAHRQLMRVLTLTGQRSAALAQYASCRRLLKQELGIEPSSETTALVESIRDGQVDKGARKQVGKEQVVTLTNVPVPLMSFVGRQREIAEIKRLLDPSGLRDPKGLPTRLLTLTGAGGCGKTRLAIEVARDLAGRDAPPERLYKNGVWWVELAALSDPALVPKQVAQVFELPEVPDMPLTTTLINYARSKEMLLVLDNCEHLIEACARLVETLLSACPKLQILATSREALGLTGEVTWYVPSLDSPDLEHMPPPERLPQYDAIRLLTERAQAVAPHWQLAEHAEATARICCRLDGIPLAIELAAARLKVLSAEQIAERLDDRFQLLTGGGRTALPRHRTLRATLDWSYNLLSDEEQALLRRLAVFAGGWTMEAAEHVCSDVLDSLTALVTKSLVVVEQKDSAMRYRMLETVRQYTHEKLIESGESRAISDRHLDYYLQLAQAASPHVLNGDPDWLDRLETEHDNLRAAMEHALAQNPESALQLAMSLEWFWGWHDHMKEAAAYAMRLLPLTEAWGPGKLRARALGLAGGSLEGKSSDGLARMLLEESLEMARAAGDKYQMAWSLYELARLSLGAGDWAQMRLYTEESRVLFQELGITWGTGNAFWQLGQAAYRSGETESARSLFEQSLAWARKDDNLGVMTFALFSLGELAHLRGDYASARELYVECAQLQRRMRYTIRLAYCLIHLGQITLREGDQVRARPHFEEALAIFRQLKRADASMHVLAGLAGVAGMAGKHQSSARLFGAVDAIFTALGWKMNLAERSLYDNIIAQARAQLDEATFNAAWAKGHAMTLEQAVEYALEETET